MCVREAWIRVRGEATKSVMSFSIWPTSVLGSYVVLTTKRALSLPSLLLQCKYSPERLDIIYFMALAKRECQLSVSALAKQSARESNRKRNVKVLDEETYVQVRTADIVLNLAWIFVGQKTY